MTKTNWLSLNFKYKIFIISLRPKTQNSPSKFHHFLFQPSKFDFCHFYPLSFIFSQLSHPLTMRSLLLLSDPNNVVFINYLIYYLFTNFKKTTRNSVGLARKKAQTISFVERGFERLGLSHQAASLLWCSYMVKSFSP